MVPRCIRILLPVAAMHRVHCGTGAYSSAFLWTSRVCAGSLAFMLHLTILITKCAFAELKCHCIPV